MRKSPIAGPLSRQARYLLAEPATKGSVEKAHLNLIGYASIYSGKAFPLLIVVDHCVRFAYVIIIIIRSFFLVKVVPFNIHKGTFDAE